jgi:hypothetical protein
MGFWGNERACSWARGFKKKNNKQLSNSISTHKNSKMLGQLVAMPILIINMGGEMMYILNQRLTAQSIPDEKASKVLSDVIRTMYTPVFLEELFKPQEIYSTVSTKQIFDKLAHSSIMRLNKTSMDKLYDLMTMGVKYQLLQAAAPIQYLQVTLRHLEGLDKLVGNNMDVKALLQNAMTRCIQLYSTLTYGDWLLCQQTLLQFFYGKRVKVSLFLQQNMQSTNGMLILSNKGNLPYQMERPGQIRYYENNKVVRTDYFVSPLKDHTKEHDQIIDLSMNCGKDLYNRAAAEAAEAGAAATTTHQTAPSQIMIDASKAFAKNLSLHSAYQPDRNRSDNSSNDRHHLHHSLLADSLSKNHPSSAAGAKPSAKSTTSETAKAEMSLLAELLGGASNNASSKDGKSGGVSPNEKPFKINLFPNAAFHQQQSKGGADGDDFADDKDDGGYEGNFIAFDIDARAEAKTMAKYMEDLDLKDNTDYKADFKRGNSNDDLLDLMDLAK